MPAHLQCLYSVYACLAWDAHMMSACSTAAGADDRADFTSTCELRPGRSEGECWC